MSRPNRYVLSVWVAALIVLLFADVHRYIEHTWVYDSSQSPQSITITLLLGIAAIVISVRRVLLQRPLGPFLTGFVFAIPVYLLVRFLAASPRSPLPLGLCVLAMICNALLLRRLNPRVPEEAGTGSTGAA